MLFFSRVRYYIPQRRNKTNHKMRTARKIIPVSGVSDSSSSDAASQDDYDSAVGSELSVPMVPRGRTQGHPRTDEEIEEDEPPPRRSSRLRRRRRSRRRRTRSRMRSALEPSKKRGSPDPFPSEPKDAYVTVPAATFAGGMEDAPPLPLTPPEQLSEVDMRTIPMIAGWMKAVGTRSTEMRDEIVIAMASRFEKMMRPLITLLMGIAGQLSRPLSDLVREKTDLEKALLEDLSLSPAQTMALLTYWSRFRPFVTTLRSVSDEDVIESIEKLRPSLLQLEKASQQIQRLQKEIRERSEEESLAELRETLATEKEKLRLAEQAVRENLFKKGIPQSEEAVPEFPPTSPLPESRHGPPFFGARIGARFGTIHRRLRMEFAGSKCPIARLATQFAGSAAAASIGANSDGEGGVGGDGLVELIRGFVLSIAREKIPPEIETATELLSAVTPATSFAINAELERVRGIMDADGITIDAINKDMSVRVKFAELVGTRMASGEYGRSARAEGGKYHAYRNKEDFVNEQAELLMWFERLTYDDRSKTFSKKGQSFGGCPRPTVLQRTPGAPAPLTHGEMMGNFLRWRLRGSGM